MIQNPPRQSKFYLMMLILCIIYAGMSLIVLGMHIYAYNRTVEFNDVVAREVSNFTNMSSSAVDLANLRLSEENQTNQMQRLPPFPGERRRLDSEFVSSAQHRASWIFGVLMAVSAIGVILPLVAGLMLHHLSSARAIIQAQESTLALLTTNEEKTIISLLRKSNGSLTQSELVSETGLTKVRVHRILARLESLGLIEKHPYGMTNKIVLVQTLHEQTFTKKIVE